MILLEHRIAQSHGSMDARLAQEEEKRHDGSDKKRNSSNSSEQFWSIHSSNDPFASDSSSDEQSEGEEGMEILCRLIE